MDKNASLRSEHIESDETIDEAKSIVVEGNPTDMNGSNRRAKGKKSRLGDLPDVSFDPKAPELQTTWSTFAPVICSINSYPNGVTFSLHTNQTLHDRSSEKTQREGQRFSPSQFHLRFKDTRDYRLAQGKYFLYKEGYAKSLERHLSRLHKKGLLQHAVVYFGTVADPFFAYHKRFEVTSTCLRLFEQYRPARLIIQTRSPMVIAALPTLRALERRSLVVVPIETTLEKAIARYTPGQPKISERLLAVQGLRKQGIPVNLCVSPVLPYGDFYRDAWDFGELLDRYADYITLGCLASGRQNEEKQLRELAVAKKLETDKHYRWLRPHAYRALHHVLSIIAPEKLQLPVSAGTKTTQMALFAA